MDETVRSNVQAFQQERESWGKFRRVLVRDDREAFDRLFRHAGKHAAEAADVSRPIPFDAVVMAILVEHEKILREIRGRLEGLNVG